MVAARGGGCGIAIAPEVAGEAAPALTFSLTLFALLTWLVSWGLLIGWNNTFGPMLEGLANALKIDVWRVHVDPAGKLREIDHAVRGALQASVSTSDMAMGFWFHQTARLQGWVADETWKLARDTFNFGEWAVKTYGPLLVTTATTVLFPWPKLYRVIDHEIEKLLPKAGKVAGKAGDIKDAALRRLLRPINIRQALQGAEIAGLFAALGALAGGLTWGGHAGSLPHGLGIPKEWWKWRSRVNTRLTKLEGIAAAGVLSVLMANVLGVTGKCLRSGNIGKTARRLCGFDSSLLDLLLLETVAIVGAVSVVEFGKELQAIEGEAVTLLGSFITEFPGK